MNAVLRTFVAHIFFAGIAIASEHFMNLPLASRHFFFIGACMLVGHFTNLP